MSEPTYKLHPKVLALMEAIGTLAAVVATGPSSPDDALPVDSAIRAALIVAVEAGMRATGDESAETIAERLLGEEPEAKS